jgi:hypothetical protein
MASANRFACLNDRAFAPFLYAVRQERVASANRKTRKTRKNRNKKPKSDISDSDIPSLSVPVEAEEKIVGDQPGKGWSEIPESSVLSSPTETELAPELETIVNSTSIGKEEEEVVVVPPVPADLTGTDTNSQSDSSRKKKTNKHRNRRGKKKTGDAVLCGKQEVVHFATEGLECEEKELLLFNWQRFVVAILAILAALVVGLRVVS